MPNTNSFGFFPIEKPGRVQLFMETRLDLHFLDGEATIYNDVKTVGRTNIDQVNSFMLFQSVTFCVVRIL